MRASIRRTTTTIILLTVLLAPGLLHARTVPVRHNGAARLASAPEIGLSGKLASVWNLLANLMKTGSTLDPSGSTSSGASTTTGTGSGDTGSTLDPSGTP